MAVSASKIREEEAPSWLASAGSAARIDAIERHAEFDVAMTMAAEGITAFYVGNRLANRLLNDRARSLFALVALGLHADPDPSGARLTAARMLAVCRQTGLCSPGRAKAMLVLLQWSGYLGSGETPADRRQRPLVPTPAMWNEFRRRWRLVLGAMAALEPTATAMESALDRPTFTTALAAAFGEAIRAGIRPLDGTPHVRDLAERDGAMMVLMSLFLADRSNAPAPTVAELARRFHLSRAHVLAILREAEGPGLVHRDEDGTIVPLPPLREALRRFFASVFALMLAAGSRAGAIEERLPSAEV